MRSSLALVALLATTAAADSTIHGFTTSGHGELTGRVTGSDGRPRAGIDVHITTGGGPEQLVRTDANGQYRTTLPGGEAYVYVDGDLRIEGQGAVSVQAPDGEAIAIREPIAPAVPAKPRADPARVPPYSERAEDRNTWTRAWLLLHVSATGKVLRVKLLDKPGLDLDAIAVREALALTFEPARDRANRRIDAMVVWTFEWPAYFWLADHQVVPGKIPYAVTLMPCGKRGTPSLRDCSRPTMGNALTLPWIEAR